MFVRRLTARLKEQQWLTIAIELVIVIIGVFIGTWVANWNQERVAKAETRQLLIQLRPEIDRIIAFSDNAIAYYRTSHRFAETAFRGWAGDPEVSDNDFVIAAYQASQVHSLNSAPTWTLVFGGDQLRNVEDIRVRQPLERLMTFNVAGLNSDQVATPYRADVRKIIPDDIQIAIRDVCGDQINSATSDSTLPKNCDVRLDPKAAAATAADLRAHPELVGELRSHFGIVAGFINAIRQYKLLASQLQRRLKSLQ